MTTKVKELGPSAFLQLLAHRERWRIRPWSVGGFRQLLCGRNPELPTRAAEQLSLPLESVPVRTGASAAGHSGRFVEARWS